MWQNPDGFMEKNKGFISSNPFMDCDSSWSDEIFHNFRSYAKYGKIFLTKISFPIKLPILDSFLIFYYKIVYL